MHGPLNVKYFLLLCLAASQKQMSFTFQCLQPDSPYFVDGVAKLYA